MRLKTIIATAALAGASLLTHYATAAAPAPAPPTPAADSLRHRWTVGLRWAGQPGFYYSSRFLPVVSYQWRPRWSVELGASYWRNRYEGTSTNFAVDGEVLEFKYRSRFRKSMLPVRVRYMLTRQSARRLQFDALAGIALSFGSGYSEYIRMENGLETDRFRINSGAFFGLAGIGAGSRYGLGRSRRLELAAELTLYHELVSSIRPNYGYYSRWKFDPVGYWGLGMNYKL